MEYKEFEKIIQNLEKCRKRSHSMHDLGIDLMSYDDIYHEVISALLLSLFGNCGKDWIDWYLYEKPGFTKNELLKAFDENNNEICHNIESLWETIKEYLIKK